MMTKARPPLIGISKHPLIGRSFQTIDKCGRTNWQGQFVAELGSGYFLAVLYDWLVGTKTHEVAFHIDELGKVLPDGRKVFRIFENQEWANSYMEAYANYRDEHIDRESREEI